MTRPEQMGVFKSLEDIHADFTLDRGDPCLKRTRVERATLALIASLGYSRAEAKAEIGDWLIYEHFGLRYKSVA